MRLRIFETFMANQDARERLFLTYVHISIIAVISYSAIFAWFGYTVAASCQIAGCVPLFISLALYEKEFKTVARVMSFMTSILLVVLQTTYIFSPGTGFHFQLFALLVVLYLISDLKKQYDRIFLAAMTSLIIISFFICENFSTDTALIVLNDHLKDIFYSISLSVTFVALNILLYLYALQLSKKEAELNNLACNDALTGIMNRGSFTRLGESLFNQLKTDHLNISVILFDIDNFKNINDTYGHHIGDKVLRELADDIKTHVRKTDLFARYGGEEFTILLPLTSAEDAYHLAEKIRDHVEKKVIQMDDTTIQFTISLGVAGICSQHDTYDDLLIHSDQALYISKNEGKNKTTLYRVAT